LPHATDGVRFSIMKRKLAVLVATFVLLCVVRLPAGEGPRAAAAPSAGQAGDKLKAAEAIAKDRSAYLQARGGLEDATYLEYNKKFTKALQAAAQSFPLVETQAPSTAGQFRKFTFNTSGVGLDGFRFKNTSQDARNFGWVFARAQPNNVTEWYIVPVEGELEGFGEFWQRSGEYENAPWKASTKTKSFGAIAQSLTGAKLLPGKEYIIWFRFKDQKPEDVYVRFDLFPINVPLDSGAQVERALKLQ